MKKIPTWLKVLLIILGIIIFISIFDSNDASKNNNDKTNGKDVTEKIPTQNTNEMVDYLVKKGKSAAKNASENIKTEAINFTKSNINNLFSDNKIMEDAIYYGALLEYSYPTNSIESNLGQDLVQAVKYVYRGVETENDISTQENIKQIKDGLNKLK